MSELTIRDGDKIEIAASIASRDQFERLTDHLFLMAEALWPSPEGDALEPQNRAQTLEPLVRKGDALAAPQSNRVKPTGPSFTVGPYASVTQARLNLALEILALREGGMKVLAIAEKRARRRRRSRT